VPIPFRAKFCSKAVEAGEAMAYPVDIHLVDKLFDARGAHIHMLLEALARYHADGHRIPVAPGCLLLRAKMLTYDPRVALLEAFVDARVAFLTGGASLETPRAGPSTGGASGVRHHLKRQEIVRAFEETLDVRQRALFANTRAADLKTFVDRIMEARGRPLLVATRVAGEPVKLSYADCRLLQPHEAVEEKGPSDTSSPLETMFRAELVRILGYDMPKARPCWLLYPPTQKALELDFYDAAKKMAIEYDGKQHYEFPNAYHKTRAEFEQQVARDLWKDTACVRHNVRLLRVRASCDPVVDAMRAVSALGITI
jgi:hypothetical protein